ncbi:MAG: glucosyl-3-phosphoglycerate synthase, partial [Jatrophihabitantaceae bacterium]
WPLESLIAAKRQTGATISVVVPARNEASSIGAVVQTIARDLRDNTNLIDELVVMDSLSSDDTAAVARAHGATVHGVADVRPDLGVQAGKGEALWKSLFVTTGSLLVFIDADLTEWGTHFVTGLLGPLLTQPDVQLARGFYDRVLDEGDRPRSTEGGRVTELVARPLLASRWPALSAVVQPLAGEWAIRRCWFEQLDVPVGYGIEFATLVDTYAGLGLDAIAQVDLGSRAHRHQHVHDLGAMALEILHVADTRSGFRPPAVNSDATATLTQFDRDLPERWQTRHVPIAQRPPAITVADYAGRVAVG